MSQVVAAICGSRRLRFAGRGLGVILFGTLILITSYVKAVSGIAKFQSWQLIVRYGGHGVAHGDPGAFQGRHRLCLRARRGERHRRHARRRVIAAAVHRHIGSASAANICGSAMLYCTLLPTMSSATPDGVLRVLDRFDLISWSGTRDPDLPARSSPASRSPLARRSPVYVAIWFVTDLARRSLYLVPRLARAASATACSRASARR